MDNNQNHEVHAIVDRSGSMNGKEADTIGGIIASIEELKKQKETNEQVTLSIKLFDHEQTLLLHRTSLDELDSQKISDILSENYRPRGQTALLDAIGESLNFYIQKKLLNVKAFKSCIIYVSTDGLENCSKKFNYETISQMIKTAEKDFNITILYLGANQDAIAEASKCGIPMERAINYTETSENTEAVYRSAASVCKRSRTEGHAEFLKAERTASCSRPIPEPNYSSPPEINYRSYNQASSPEPPPVVRVRGINNNQN